MPMIAILLTSCLVTLVAVIGLADGLTHLLCWTARSLKDPDAPRARGTSAEPAGRDRLAA
jgi:hypothetical protein